MMNVNEIGGACACHMILRALSAVSTETFQHRRNRNVTARCHRPDVIPFPGRKEGNFCRILFHIKTAALVGVVGVKWATKTSISFLLWKSNGKSPNTSLQLLHYWNFCYTSYFLLLMSIQWTTKFQSTYPTLPTIHISTTINRNSDSTGITSAL